MQHQLKMVTLAILFILIGNYTWCHQVYDLSGILEEKIVMDNRVIIGNDQKLVNILLAAMAISLDNIVNRDTTLSHDNRPYNYKYIHVNPDLSFSFVEKEKYRIVYDPTHPMAHLSDDLRGYVLFPNISLDQEILDITHILEILHIAYGNKYSIPKE